MQESCNEIPIIPEAASWPARIIEIKYYSTSMYSKVTKIDSIWAWTRKTLLPGLHPVLHDGSGESEPFIADRVSLLLGVVRIRQVRIQTGNYRLSIYSFTEQRKLYLQVKDFPGVPQAASYKICKCH